MCGTTWIEYTCSHSVVQARAGSTCPIGFANGAVPNMRLFCWEAAQGIERAEGLCGSCRYRQQKYGTTDPAVSMQMLTRAVEDLKERRAAKALAAEASQGKQPSETDPSSSRE